MLRSDTFVCCLDLGTSCGAPEELAVPPERIAGSHIRELLPTLACPTLAAIDRALANGEVVRQEYALPLPQGLRHYEARHVPCGPDEVVTVVRDITALHQIQEERLRLAEQAQRAQRLESLGLLAGGVAHDFNNILTGILAGTELALDELPAEGPLRARLEGVRADARRAAELTRALLACSGGGRFVVEPVDLSRIVAELTTLLGASVSKKATLDVELDQTGLLIEADAAQIRQVVMNLVTNASDALGERGGRITVRTCRGTVAEGGGEHSCLLGRPPAGEGTLLVVSDTGCGMDAATLGRVFDPCFSTKFVGRGLGLPAVEAIARGHGGAVSVRSVPGEGTTVAVAFPSAAAVSAPVERAPASPRPAPPIRSTGRILVADDEPSVREVLAAILGRAGYSVELAVDGVDAVDRFSAAPDRYDLVLLDMTMPRMGGAETYRELRRICSDVPVVLISGYAREDAVGRFGDSGLAGFVHKPFQAGELLSRVRDALRPRPPCPPARG